MKLIEYKEKSINENVCLSEFEKYLKKNKLDHTLKVGSSSVTATHFVGVIKYKKFQIEILPKLVSNIENEENVSAEEEKNILRNLIFMLSYTKNLDIKISENSKLTTCKNPFLEILIREFAQSLFNCLKRITPKNYIREEDNLNYLKGKLKFTENIRYNCSNQARFYCEFDEYSENNILNQLFLYVATCLYSVSHDSKNKKLLKFIMNYFCDITLTKFDRFKTNKIKLSKNQEIFKKPFNLAKMFIEKSSVDLSKNKIENISLLWDMNKLFEEFIAEIASSINGLEIKPQKKRKLLKDDNCKKRDTFIDIYENNSDTVLDTKYKNIESIYGVSNSDIYQVSTYCLLHDSKNAILLYPQGKNRIDKDYQLNTFAENETRTIKFKTIDITRDFQKNENLENLKEEIKELFIPVLN